uniref:(northern house mosquito) hypothetical protein n=1 Tax=Culex pipiens TaxID=7175 RepID=A0A8D8KIH1_CULPI
MFIILLCVFCSVCVCLSVCFGSFHLIFYRFLLCYGGCSSVSSGFSSLAIFVKFILLHILCFAGIYRFFCSCLNFLFCVFIILRGGKLYRAYAGWENLVFFCT